ncbi:MAG: LysR family transcriptional regulator [Clostridia bacterium]|nr:LysR family transcriptional regulator [Clostridia bacterium]
MEQVTLDLYRVFLTVAEEGSFSAAARRLYLTQPAVSQAVAQLERQIGTTLFLRSVRGALPTAEGALLLEDVREALALLERGRQRIERLHRLEAGELRVGAGDTVTRYFLLPRLSQFAAAWPGLKLSLQNGTTGELCRCLAEGTVDLALVSLPLAEEGVAVRPCLPVHDIFVAAPDHPLSAGPVSWEALSGTRLIMLERQSLSRRVVDEALAAQAVQLTPEIELGSHDLLMDFAASGLGVSCVVREFAAARLAEGRLVELRTPPLPARAIGLAWAEDRPLPAAAQAFFRQVAGD